MKNLTKYWIVIVVVTFAEHLPQISASIGDSTTFFQNCCENCDRTNCINHRQDIAPHAVEYIGQTIFDKTLAWSCRHECQYICMWKTVDSFLKRGWDVPQFYGKWPFVKIFGLQEPASVIFSLMNLFTNLYLLKNFRKTVRKESPCFGLWHIFYLFCINGWIWSTIFHARDFPSTEFLDYMSAYSIVLVLFYCSMMRMIHNRSAIFKGLLSGLFMSFYINYFIFLSTGQINYSYNMKVNIITGVLSGIGWLTWCFLVRKRRPYYKKMLLFYILFGLSMCLEILDFPPILWTFDAHSLWHLSSVPISFILHNFIVEDCQTLRKEKMLGDYDINKKSI